jgi:cell division protein FtsI/penicillin-binding protein 2
VPVDSPPRGRHRLVTIFFVIGWTVLTYRLASIQVLNRGAYRQQAVQQHHREVTLAPRRGDILDRKGRVLATDRLLHTVGVHPRLIEDPDAVTNLLADLTGEPATHWLDAIAERNRFFYAVRRGDLIAEPPPVHELPMGLEIVEEYRRAYPGRSVAASVLGYVGVDGNGLEGIELQYEELLGGQPGLQVQQVDATGATIPGLEAIRESPVNGQTLYLTLDAVVQEILEEELNRGIAEYEARGGSAVALDPRTGAVLAMANLPTFDPNAPELVAADVRRNRAVTDPFEPGSVLKIVTFAAAIDAGQFAPADTIDGGNGVIQVVGAEINDTTPHGRMSLGQVLQFSSNVGTVKIAQGVGESRMYQHARDFGFGQSTGVDLPGESGGVLRKLSEWRGPALESLSIGYGLSVTTLQIASAYGAVANGGSLMRPYLVESIEDSRGRHRVITEPEETRQVTREETSAILRGFLKEAVLTGTGGQALVAGLNVAGKTGTARKASAGGYQAGAYISSFCGFLPADTPRFLLFVVVDEPAGRYYGSEVAAPIFARTVRRLMSHPDRPLDGFRLQIDRVVAHPAPVIPDLRKWPAAEAGRALIRRGFRVRFVGQGPSVVAQEPQPRLPAEEGQVVVLHLSAPESDDVAEHRQLPDLRGMTLREAATVAPQLGLRLNAVGSGVVISQDPPPGRAVQTGQTVTIRAGSPGGGG